MTTLCVPPLEALDYPTLGPGVGEWQESHLAFGPGDLLGQPYRLDEEDQAFLDILYSVFPKGHPREGKRVFDVGVLMTRKGSKKTERAGAIAATELGSDAPVRFDGWRRQGSAWVPVGRPVTDPYIPLVAFSEKQAEDTTFSALYAMLSLGPAADDYDIGLSRIMRRSGDGKAEALANAPDSRDGGRTTFQVKEETHRWVLPRQIEAHHTMTANLAKRPIAEPWELHVTTAYTPGEGSLAQTMHEAARVLTGEKVRSSRLFFFYRWADEKIDIGTAAGLHRAIVESSGPSVAAFSDIGRIASQWDAPGADQKYLSRVWLNRLERRVERAFDSERWAFLSDPLHVVPKGARISAGFDGSRTGDWSALIATELETGYQWPVDIWDPTDYGGEIPGGLVDVAVDGMFHDYKVVRFYADPPYWKDEIVSWRGRYGDKVVLPWETWRNRQTGNAFRNYAAAIDSGALSHSGDPVFASHIGHCFKKLLNERDDKGERLWSVRKERDDSPLKIDAAVAGCLSWEARMDAIASGALTVFRSAYEDEPLTVAAR